MARYIVRFGVMRALGVFSTSRGETFVRASRVITRTDRGLEIGEVLCEATDEVIKRLRESNRGQILHGCREPMRTN